MSAAGSVVTEQGCVAATTIEVAIKGKWFTVPALNVNGKALIVKRSFLKTAIVDREEWLETDLEDPELCIKQLKNRHAHPLRADVFTFTQKPSVTVPKFNYYREMDSIAGIDTSNYQRWWENLPQDTRKNVRRSQKRGVIVTLRELDDQLCSDLVELNNDSPVRQGKPYTHYGKSQDQVKKDQESFAGRRELICAYFGDELVGYMKIIYRGDVASILHLLPKASHADKRPSNAMVAKAVEVCAQKGVSLLTFGKFNYGNKRDNPLREFKTRNGFEEILVPRYYVPLTVKGAVGIRLGLHRGLIGMLPHGVITLGTKVRANWYSVKQSISRCSLIGERSNSTRQTECSNPPAGSNI
jgi:hypothetical protein